MFSGQGPSAPWRPGVRARAGTPSPSPCFRRRSSVEDGPSEARWPWPRQPSPGPRAQRGASERPGPQRQRRAAHQAARAAPCRSLKSWRAAGPRVPRRPQGLDSATKRRCHSSGSAWLPGRALPGHQRRRFPAPGRPGQPQPPRAPGLGGPPEGRPHGLPATPPVGRRRSAGAGGRAPPPPGSAPCAHPLALHPLRPRRDAPRHASRHPRGPAPGASLRACSAAAAAVRARGREGLRGSAGARKAPAAAPGPGLAEDGPR